MNDQTCIPAPAWKCSPFGNRRYWTRERMIEALRDLAFETRGALPCSDELYNPLKRGRADLPTASSIYREFGSFAHAWLAAGVAKSRVTLHNVPWTTEEEDTLFSLAGTVTLKAIAARLGRSYGAVRARLNKTHGVRARDVQCYLSAAQIAQRFHAPLSRVVTLIARGELKATKRLGRWQIDLRDAEAIAGRLMAPKRRSYQGSPPDMGDYDKRYHLRRRRRPDGRVERYEVVA